MNYQHISRGLVGCHKAKHNDVMRVALNFLTILGSLSVGNATRVAPRVVPAALRTSRSAVEMSTGSRRLALLVAAAAATTSPLSVWADYGESAKVALPALVPSPFRPTGEMAKYCESEWPPAKYSVC